jgi:hypothetical protein
MQTWVEYLPEVVGLDHGTAGHRRQLLRAGEFIAGLGVPPHDLVRFVLGRSLVAHIGTDEHATGGLFFRGQFRKARK